MTTQTAQPQHRFVHVPNTNGARAEVRQFLLALTALAFVLSTLGTRVGGPTAFAADIVLVMCGAWTANQLIRGWDIFRIQVGVVLQAYFVGLLASALVLFAVGWLLFLPSEFENLGRSMLAAGTFTLNLELALLPRADELRFDGILDHLWVISLIGQCCAILAAVYWLLRKNILQLLTVLGILAILSLSVSTSNDPIVQLLPIGGLWAFLFGAIPFFVSNRYPVLRYALLLGIANLVTAVTWAVLAGDTLFARAFFGLAFAFLYLGSRAQNAPARDTQRRRSSFALALHMFLWAVPLVHLTTALDILSPTTPSYTSLMVPCLLLALISWSLWQKVQTRLSLNHIAPTLVIAVLLLGNGVIQLAGQNPQWRFPQSADAYLDAIEHRQEPSACDAMPSGPLAGLPVCQIGVAGAPTVLVWGDHQLTAMRAGYEEAARRAEVSALFIALPNCIPLDGLQTRLSDAKAQTGRECDQHAAQVMQALPHLPSLRHVALVADWMFYSGAQLGPMDKRAPIRIAPLDGSPINTDRQLDYISQAVDDMSETLSGQGLRLSVLRQVPVQAQFDAEIAARAATPGSFLYDAMPALQTTRARSISSQLHRDVDTLFRNRAATGTLSYVDTWPTFCSSQTCDVRGGLSTDYADPTRLTRSGALALAPVLEEDLKRAKTHSALRLGING